MAPTTKPPLLVARFPTSNPSKKNGRLSSRLSLLMIPLRRNSTMTSLESRVTLELGEGNDVLLSRSIRRPLEDDREGEMRELRGLFMDEPRHPDLVRMPDKQWMRMRACMEVFALSAYCSLAFLTLAAKHTQSLHFTKKLKTFLKRVEHWCSWDLPCSLVMAFDTVRIIEDVIAYATVPKQFAANGCFWKDVISKALVYDFREFNKAFLDSTVIDVLLDLKDDPLQNVVDVVQIAIKRSVAPDTRELDRFLKVTVEKRGILPSSIFLTGIRRIGSNFVHGGGFADVWKGQYEGTPVALKVLRIFSAVDREKMQLEFIKEALLWRKLDHPNVLPFLGICRDEFAPQMALVSQWMDRGSLVDFLERNPQADCLKLVIGVACGLEYLHCLKRQVIHGDLRAANVLVDENNEPRITDFGLARAIDSQGTSIATSFKGRGTLRWQAPELLYASRFGEETSKLTAKSDVYAFACLCLEIFTGKVPFAGLRDGQVIMEVAVHDKRPPRPGQDAVLKGLNDEIWSIMQLCWDAQPTNRPDMSSVVSHLQRIEFERGFFFPGIAV